MISSDKRNTAEQPVPYSGHQEEQRLKRDIYKKKKYFNSVQTMADTTARNTQNSFIAAQRSIEASFKKSADSLSRYAAGTVFGFTRLTNNLGETLRGSVRSVSQSILKNILKFSAGSLLGVLFPGGGLLSKLLKFHTGGKVPKGHTSYGMSGDEHLAVVRSGEYVLSKKAVQSLGMPLVSRLNTVRSVTSNSHAGPFNITIVQKPYENAGSLAVRLSDHLKRYYNKSLIE